MPDDTKQIRIRQNIFYKKFIDYMNLVGVKKRQVVKRAYASKKSEIGFKETEKQKLSEERKKAIEGGLCYGFAIVHSYMAAKGKSSWWESVLGIVATWDGQAASLDQLVTMPEGSRDKQLTYRQLFERVSSYVLHNFGVTTVSEIPNIDQSTFLRPGGPFVSENGGIKFYRSFCGYFDEVRLITLLNNMKHTPPLEAIVCITSPTHACSLRYSPSDNSWYFYDPNYKQGERKFGDTLIGEIFRVLGRNLAIQVASWQEGTDANGLKEIERYAPSFYSGKNIPSLLAGSGLHMVARYAPDQFKSIVQVVGANKLIQDVYEGYTKSQETGKERDKIMIRKILANTPAALKGSRAPTLTLNALKKAQEILGEGIPRKTGDWHHFFSRTTPVNDENLKKHMDARKQYEYYMSRGRFGL